jgi:predicted amino acid dehydrogenase
VALPAAPRVVRRRDTCENRFAFLFHPLTTRNYADADASLQRLSDSQLENLAACVSENCDPFVVGDGTIQSPAGATASGEFIVVPHTAADLAQMTHREAITSVRVAAEMARDRGARIIGLGGFVSVVTRGGLYLSGTGLPALTTGNSYTAAAGKRCVEAELARKGGRLDECTVAVVGATGSIGRAVALLLADQTRRLILIGNPRHPAESKRRLSKISAETGTDSDIVITCDAAEWLPQSDVIITATSAVGELVRPEDVRQGAVICDISRPANVSQRFRDTRPDVAIVTGGIIRLPADSALSFRLDLPDGHVYACMAETMLLALEGRFEDTSLGIDLDVAQVREFEELARRHGFEIAGTTGEGTCSAGAPGPARANVQ